MGPLLWPPSKARSGLVVACHGWMLRLLLALLQQSPTPSRPPTMVGAPMDLSRANGPAPLSRAVQTDPVADTLSNYRLPSLWDILEKSVWDRAAERLAKEICIETSLPRLEQDRRRKTRRGRMPAAEVVFPIPEAAKAGAAGPARAWPRAKLARSNLSHCYLTGPVPTPYLSTAECTFVLLLNTYEC